VESLIRALQPLNPAEINIIAVHAVLSNPAVKRLNQLHSEGLLNRVIITDSIFYTDEKIESLEVVTSTELSANVIRTFMTKKSMSGLMDPFDAEKYFKSSGLFSER